MLDMLSLLERLDEQKGFGPLESLELLEVGQVRESWET